MSKVSKIFYRFQGFKCYVCQRHWRWCLRLLCKYIQTQSVLHTCPSHLQEGGPLLRSPCPEGLAVYYHAVQGGSFVLKHSGTCQTTRVIAGKTHSQSPICEGTQQPSNSYISMGTKLHPPYPKQTACQVWFWSKKCLQCLKNVGLYNSFGVGRFSFMQSWLTQASRLANSQASASNAGVPGDPNSNCSYLALIWSIKELYSLCASCSHQVDWFGYDGYTVNSLIWI